ncbi:MAG: YdcF family protein [Salaquimonas sp.]|nr:YdcF family protein [Salaquimonas sp.]
MFFAASKIFWVFARPLNALFLLSLLAGALALFGRRRFAGWLFALCAALFALIGFTQLPDALLYRLEISVTAQPLKQDPYGIIVLGGGLAAESAAQSDDYHLGEAADRIVKGLELKRRFPGARMIYSGGENSLLQQNLPEAQAARRMIEALYGTTDGVEFEYRSRNTWENAVYTAALVGDDKSYPWLLVTSAFHMKRALGCFRKVGMNVIPVPTDFRADPLRFPWLTGDMAGQFLKMNILAKEWIGLFAYRLAGHLA